MAIGSTIVVNISGVIEVMSSDEATDPISNEILQRFHIIMTGFWMVICVTGICTNALNLRAFWRIGLDDSVTISFFVLAISDANICSIAFVELVAFLGAVLEKEYNWLLYLSPIIPSFLLMCVRRIFNTTTILITTFLAVQRCMCVVLPFHVRGMFTKFRTYLFMATIFTFCVICFSLFIWRHHVVPVMNDERNITQLMIYVPPGSEPYLLLMEVVLGIILNITCQVILVICLFVMGYALQKSVRFRQAATSASSNLTEKEKASDQAKAGGEKSSVKETQAIIQVALVSVIFVTTNSPYLGFGIANLMIPEFGINEAFNNLYHLVHNIMFTAELLNSSVNFVVYYKYNSKFRASFNTK